MDHGRLFRPSEAWRGSVISPVIKAVHYVDGVRRSAHHTKESGNGGDKMHHLVS